MKKSDDAICMYVAITIVMFFFGCLRSVGWFTLDPCIGAACIMAGAGLSSWLSSWLSRCFMKPSPPKHFNTVEEMLRDSDPDFADEYAAHRKEKENDDCES